MECEHIVVAAQNGKDWVDYLSALLTPTIAVLGAFIAWRQWRTDRNRLRHELFDRRYQQFTVIRDFLVSIMTSGKSKVEEQQKFLAGTRGIRFVFDKEMSDYVDSTIWNLAVDLECLDSELLALPVGDERSKNVKRQSEIKKALNMELRNLEEKFARYLHLRH